MTKELITIREAARRSGYSEKWIRKAVKKGELKANQWPMGSGYVYEIDPVDLDAWLNREQKPRGPASNRRRYILVVPTDLETEHKIIEFAKTLVGASLQRSDGQILTDTRTLGEAEYDEEE